MDYLEPVKISAVDREDYEVIPNLELYEQPHSGIFDDARYAAVPIPSYETNFVSSVTLRPGEGLPEDEELYVDPGHVKEKIYEWFEQRKIRKLHKNDVRYSAFIMLQLHNFYRPPYTTSHTYIPTAMLLFFNSRYPTSQTVVYYL